MSKLREAIEKYGKLAAAMECQNDDSVSAKEFMRINQMGFTAALDLLSGCVQMIEHPWVEGLDCECGYYGDDSEETGMSECVKCGIERTRKELKAKVGDE